MSAKPRRAAEPFELRVVCGYDCLVVERAFEDRPQLLEAAKIDDPILVVQGVGLELETKRQRVARSRRQCDFARHWRNVADRPTSWPYVFVDRYAMPRP